MRQKRVRVQQSIRPSVCSRPSARSRFVSFSGGGSPKSKVKRKTKTPRIPYRYTNEQKWNIFITNGRPIFHKSCLLLCHVIYETESCSFWEESHSHLPGEHAEVKALKQISRKEQEADTNARFVSLFLSYSPCARCANFIINFSTSRPKCQLSLAFSCLYKHEEEVHRDGLRRLNATPGIFLGVFTNREWMHVAAVTGLSFHEHSRRRQAGDLRWKAEFENILTGQAGTTSMSPLAPSQQTSSSVVIPATDVPRGQGSISHGFATNSAFSQTGTTSLRPLAPSQQTSRNSAVIPATHIPQGRGLSSRGVGTSSALSQGRVSRMGWQRPDYDRDVLLDAVSVDIPEGNGAASRCANKESVCCLLLILAFVAVGGVLLHKALF